VNTSAGKPARGGGDVVGATPTVCRQDGEREALLRLCQRYAAGVDGRDVVHFLGAFAPDAEVRVYEPPGTGDRPNRTMKGHDEIGLIVERISYYSRTTHVIGSCSFDLDGTGATGRVDCAAHHFLPSPQDDVDRMMHVRYEDGYRRDERREWKITRREVRILDREETRALPEWKGP
jgi:hypothetical protein